MTKIEVEPKNGLNRTIQEMFYLQSVSMNNRGFIDFVKKTFPSSCPPCIPGQIWNYVLKNFKYVSDDPYDEIIRAPHIMLIEKKGDCDDFALFIKTCLDIIGGFNTQYLLLGIEPEHFTHILVFANRGYCKGRYFDPVYIDGANSVFNVIPEKYKYFKLIG